VLLHVFLYALFNHPTKESELNTQLKTGRLWLHGKGWQELSIINTPKRYENAVGISKHSGELIREICRNAIVRPQAVRPIYYAHYGHYPDFPRAGAAISWQ
jgi:hypothetical protein